MPIFGGGKFSPFLLNFTLSTKMKQRRNRDNTTGWDRGEKRVQNDQSHFQFEIHSIK
jgi:hypothetical protein